MSPTDEHGELPVCACGHNRNSAEVDTIPRYGFWGWTAIAMGATVTPRRVDFACGRCGVVFDSISDPKALQGHA